MWQGVVTVVVGVASRARVDRERVCVHVECANLLQTSPPTDFHHEDRRVETSLLSRRYTGQPGVEIPPYEVRYWMAPCPPS